MKRLSLLVLAASGFGAMPLVAADDGVWRDCRTCHVVESPGGEVLARGGRSGPNLYGIAGAPIAGDGNFRFYTDDLRAAGATGARWNESNFVAYMSDPDQFLQEVTNNPDAEGGMHVQLRSGARDVFEFLQSLSE